MKVWQMSAFVSNICGWISIYDWIIFFIWRYVHCLHVICCNGMNYESFHRLGRFYWSYGIFLNLFVRILPAPPPVTLTVRFGALGNTGYCNYGREYLLGLRRVFFLWSNYSILYVPPARPSVLVSNARHYTDGWVGVNCLLSWVDSPIVGVGESAGSVQFEFNKTLLGIFWLEFLKFCGLICKIFWL